MSAIFYGAVYVCAGIVVAILLRRRGAATRDWTVAIFIWPLTLPSVVMTGARSSSEDPIRAATAAVEAAWGDGNFGDPRELGAVRAFVQKLTATQLQIQQMAEVLRGSKLAVGDKLVSVKVMREQQLVEGVRLLDELTGQLVLLRFSRGADAANTDRRRIEELLARIESLAHLTSSDALGSVDNALAK